MIETRQKQERVILIGVALPNSENFDLSMEELASLAKTAGAEVVQTHTQKRDQFWYSPEMIVSHHSLLSRYHLIVFLIPSANFVSGNQPSSL